jgi:hypothetical protein
LSGVKLFTLLSPKPSLTETRICQLALY